MLLNKTGPILQAEQSVIREKDVFQDESAKGEGIEFRSQAIAFGGMDGDSVPALAIQPSNLLDAE